MRRGTSNPHSASCLYRQLGAAGWAGAVLNFGEEGVKQSGVSMVRSKNNTAAPPAARSIIVPDSDEAIQLLIGQIHEQPHPSRRRPVQLRYIRGQSNPASKCHLPRKQQPGAQAARCTRGGPGGTRQRSFLNVPFSANSASMGRAMYNYGTTGGTQPQR